jgi:hypothetical protein
MTRGLERRVRKLEESTLPPLLTEDVSWMFGLLWFAIAYHLGNPAPQQKPFVAFAQALGYANESELNSAMVRNYREVSNRLYSAEDKVCAKFGIFRRSLEDRDAERLWDALERMEGWPASIV